MVYQSPEAKIMSPLDCLNCSHPTLVDELVLPFLPEVLN